MVQASVAGNSLFRPDLQGLRAIAVILVVLAHADVPWLEGGFIGVDVFFVLSGYLISRLLLNELDQTGRIRLFEFYARRIKRLLPALLLMVCATCLAASVLLSAHEARGQLTSAPYAATWLSNFYFTFKGRDYFDDLAASDLFIHTWSLGVEEQFYLIWPFLLSLIAGQFILRKAKDIAAYTAGKLLLIAIISYIFSLYLSFTFPTAAFFMMPSRIWQFAVGALVYVVFEHPRNSNKRAVLISLTYSTSRIFFWCGLALIISSALVLHSDLTYPGLWAIFPTAGAALAITGGLPSIAPFRVILSHPVLVWVGDRSYSIYLWHWPVLILGFSFGLRNQLIPTVGLILTSVLLAILSFRLVELPFWKGILSQQKIRIVYLAAFMGTLAVIALNFNILQSLPNHQREGNPNLAWSSDLPPIYSKGCDDWYHNDRLKPCYFGSSRIDKTIVIIGDSIGLQWFSMLRDVFSEPDWRTIVLTKSACPMVDEEWFYDRINQVYKVCDSWREKAVNWITDLKPDVIAIGSAATYDFSETQWIEGSSRIFSKLSSAANTIILIPGTPSLGFNGPGCLIRNGKKTSNSSLARQNCIATDRLEEVSVVSYYLSQAAGRFSNVQVIDMNDSVCPNEICGAIDLEGDAVFRDQQHLTDTFVTKQAPVFKKHLADKGIIP